MKHNAVLEYVELRDTFCVGGPLSNVMTAYYLSRYLPGIRMVNAKGQVVMEWNEGGGFMIGEKGLFDSQGEQYAILVK